MKRSLIVGISVIALVSALAASYAYAAKPPLVIENSNGFPSGAHYNMNIHGKNWDFQCDPTPGGGSVFIPEYTDEQHTATLTMVSGRNAGLDELKALDPCAEAFDGDPIRVWLPAQEQGYWVFARIGGKPQNGQTKEASNILLVPNADIRVCNDTETTTCPAGDGDDYLFPLGLVTGGGAYEATGEEFLRFIVGSAPGKGKNNAVNITDLFTWSGYVCDASLDISGPDGVPDGVIDAYDVPESYNTNGTAGIQADELDAYLKAMAALEVPLCTYYPPQWVFNIADLVEQDTTITNDGTKLLQVRFYPVATTSFIPTN